MLRVLLPRLILAALPFVVYFVWRQWMLRSGRSVDAAPWGWLVGIGAVLVAISLMATALLQRDHSAETYVPAEARPDGGVTPGRFEK